MSKDVVECLDSVMKQIDGLYTNNLPFRGIPTGFVDFDSLTGGLQPSTLMTIAGRPSMGKSLLAMNIAINVAIKSNLPILIFSMESTADDFMLRIISSLTRINLYNLQNGRLDDEHWPRLSSAVEMLCNCKIFINDSPGLIPQDITELANKKSEEWGELGLIVVDYLQLMNVETGNEYPRSAQLSEITRCLKSLAKNLNVCIIAISQLNRDSEKRLDKRPLLDDLLDSGSIENDSDLVVFVYRDEVYYGNSPDKGSAEIIVAKNRHGQVAKVKLAFMSQYQCFENYVFS